MSVLAHAREADMPRTRKEEAPLLLDEPEVTGRYVELGGYTVSFETFHTDVDPGPLFRGLPDDRCQCPPRSEQTRELLRSTSSQRY
jgi:hypothetical protein